VATAVLLSLAALSGPQLVDRPAAERVAVAPPPFRADATTVADCAARDLDCLAQALGNLAVTEGTPAAAAALRARGLEAADPVLCHQVAHGIGVAAAARERGDVVRAMANGFDDCASGFYHGVLLRAFVEVGADDPQTLGAAGRAACARPEILRERALTINCAHGTGHGYLIATGDLDAAIAACEAAGEIGHRSRAACADGVFMELFRPSDGGPGPAVTDLASAVAPCARFAPEDARACYPYTAGRLLGVTGDVAHAIVLCGDLDEIARPFCIEDLGSSVGGDGTRTPDEVVALCARAAGETERCILSAARQAARAGLARLLEGGLQPAVAYCDRAAAIARCYRALGAMVVDEGLGDPLEICRYTGAAATECLHGARRP